jgi:hypothetical protein
MGVHGRKVYAMELQDLDIICILVTMTDMGQPGQVSQESTLNKNCGVYGFHVCMAGMLVLLMVEG